MCMIQYGNNAAYHLDKDLLGCQDNYATDDQLDRRWNTLQMETVL